MNKTHTILIIGFIAIICLILGIYLYDTKDERCVKRILNNNPDWKNDPRTVKEWCELNTI